MKLRKYTCGAYPLGKKGGVCGAGPREHTIHEPEIVSPVTGRTLPQHRFIATEGSYEG